MAVLPSSVTIDAVVYQVKVVDADELMQATRQDNCLGYVLHTKNIIYVLDTLAPSAQEAVLIHEAIHALDNQHDLDLSESDVRTLGVAIPAFLKANGFWHNPHIKEGKHGRVHTV